uniref:Retrotransposon gag domain-containing protein n=1 Tax=Lactuca sativa TaxID=4236 RepID=A0A9R1UVS4_LACSA|nr:hypothetical protein LSAT_V11C800429260 [Lactuca sativa]
MVKQLEEEFLRLEQGNMTVREYTTKFTEKARFAEFYISTEERRVARYIWGLRIAIREFVQIQKPGTFQFVVDAAEGREHRALGKRKWDGTNNDSKKGKTSVGVQTRQATRELLGIGSLKARLEIGFKRARAELELKIKLVY